MSPFASDNIIRLINDDEGFKLRQMTRAQNPLVSMQISFFDYFTTTIYSSLLTPILLIVKTSFPAFLFTMRLSFDLEKFKVLSGERMAFVSMCSIQR